MSLAAVSFHPLAKQSKDKRDIPALCAGSGGGLGAGGRRDVGGMLGSSSMATEHGEGEHSGN